jgi:hypothetical protein
MNSQLPVTIQYLQALATPALALLAIVIAFGQSRTAHQRAVLDLFDRRMAKYEAIRQIVSQVVREGSVRNEDAMAFLRATNDVEFLFRSEVKTSLTVCIRRC